MPSQTGGWASFFHFGAKTWRPKTAEQSFLEFEKKKHAEEVERKQSEVQKKIELLDHIRNLEAKTQALNEMALSAELETKEHELAMRERQMAESREIELAKLELAKRMGQDSLNEVDLARIKRERMKAELLARASNDHAMQELNRAVGQSEMDHPTSSHMPQPPLFMPSERFMSPNAGQIPMSGPIPMHHFASTPGPIFTSGSLPRHEAMYIPGPMSIPDPMFMPGPRSTPGHMHLPAAGRYSPGDFHDGFQTGPHRRPRGMSESFAYPSHFDRVAGDFDRGGRDPSRGPSRNMFYDSDFRASDHFNPQRRHPSNGGFWNHHEPIEAQMVLRAQAERLYRKKFENFDHKARQHNLNAHALRELRKRELISSLRERGAHQREIEAQASKLIEHDRRLNEPQLRELRDNEYRRTLKAKGLQEREIVEHFRRREDSDREILRKELQSLERELRRNEILEAELAIRRAQEKGEGPPMGVPRPTIEEIRREGLLSDFMDGFQELNPRLQEEILSMSAHYKPQSRMPSMNDLHQTRASGSHTPGSSRAGREPVSRSSSRAHSTRGNNSPDQVRRAQSSRLSSAALVGEQPNLDLHHGQNDFSNEYTSESTGQPSRDEASLNDATLAARLQSAAVNSEINGGKRSRASSHVSLGPDDYSSSGRHRPAAAPSPLNPRAEGRSRSSTNSDLLRSYSNSSSSEYTGNHRSRRNGTSQSSSNESRNIYNNAYGLNPDQFSQLSTEEIEMLLGGHGTDPSVFDNFMNTNHLSKEEIEQMSAEEFDAMFPQNQACHLNTGMSNLNFGSSQSSHRMGGLSRHSSVSRTPPSNSPLRQSSGARRPLSRSVSRGGTSSSNQSSSNRQDSRSTSRPTTAINQSLDGSPSSSTSHHQNSGQRNLASDQRRSTYDHQEYQVQGDPAENDVTVTEKSEQPGATIHQRLGRIQANSHRNTQSINAQQDGLSERDQMHLAVKNLIAEANRAGANGVISLRIHDCEDGSFEASSEAVILAPQ